MAETAGLVIGGIGLLSLFDSCMSAFEYVDSGRQYGKDYNKAALKINLLRLRLSRWKQTVDIRDSLDGISNKVQVASPDEVKRVEELLGYIGADLKTAEEKSQRYQLKNAPPPDNSPEAQTIDLLSDRVRDLAVSRQKSGTFGQRAKWALLDKRRFASLIDDLGENIASLVELFPATVARQAELAVVDVTEVIQPAAIEEPEDAYAMMHEASEGVDEQLLAAVEKVAAAQIDGYVFEKMRTEDDAQAQFGTYFGKGEYQRNHKANARFNDVVAKGRARVHYGDNVGGPYVLGPDFHAGIHGSGTGDARGSAQQGGQQMQPYGRRQN